MSIGPFACRNARIATSTVTCAAGESTNRAISRRSKPKSPIARGLRRAVRCARCSLAAARPRSCALRRCRASSTRSGPPGASTKTPRLRSKPTRPASKPSDFAAIGRPGSTGCRSAFRRSTTLILRPSAASTVSARRWRGRGSPRPRAAAVSSLFPRFTFDLIYGRPGQSDAGWRRELTEALNYVGDHISLYQLTIEPDTMFERLRDAGKLELPDEELSLALFQATRELTYARGLPAYEVSTHAPPGGESRHNLIYWRYGEYAGVGPGAHGRLVTAKGRLAQETERHPEMWLTLVESEGNGLVESVPLSREEQGDEFLLMGLRLSEGVDPRAFEKLSGRLIDPERIRSLVEDGFLELDERGRIRVTAMGAPLLDTVVADVAA